MVDFFYLSFHHSGMELIAVSSIGLLDCSVVPKIKRISPLLAPIYFIWGFDIRLLFQASGYLFVAGLLSDIKDHLISNFKLFPLDF